MRRAILPTIYAVSMSFSFVMNMLVVLIPLYAISLGFSLAEIGMLISSQAAVQVSLRLFTGVVTDRFGERKVMLFGFCSILAASLLFVLSSQFWALITAQLLIGATRGVYWTAAPSYLSRAAEGTGEQSMGRFFSFHNLGNLVGAIVAGVMATALGFNISFLTTAIMAAFVLILTWTLPELQRKGQLYTVAAVLSQIGPLLKRRPLFMGALMAFGTAIWIGALHSFYPSYFTSLGYSGSWIGLFTSVHGLGGILVGLIIGQIRKRFGGRITTSIGFGGIAAAVIGTIAIGQVSWVLILLMIASGFAFNLAMISWNVIATAYSEPAQRGMSLTLVSLFWTLGQLIVPVALGLFASARGLTATLWLIAALMLLFGLFTHVLYPFLFAPEQAEATAAQR